MDRNLLLYLHSTAHGPVNAVEHDEQRIATGLDDPAAVLFDRWVDQVRAESAQPFECSCVIQPDQTAVANHIGIDDGDQLPPILRLSCGRGRWVCPWHYSGRPATRKPAINRSDSMLSRYNSKRRISPIDA